MATRTIVVLKRGISERRPERHLLSGNISFIPALMHLENIWARTQVYLVRTRGGRKLYLCPFCASDSHAFELVTSRDVGILRLRGKVVRLKAALSTHQCPNKSCGRQYVVLKGTANEIPVDLERMPYVAV